MAAPANRPQPEVLPTQPQEADKSLGALVADMTSEVSTLMRKEVELAKVELKEEVSRAGKAGGMLGAGALTGYLTILFASFALAWLLDAVMPVALAFLLVAVLYGIAAAVLITRGREQIKHVDPVPRQTVETLKEDMEWAKAQKS
ncbi:MAG: phage holin family protein [Acidimicrobiales bacterium]|nr:phage holin family protein [Actinomycetota bacterium]